MDTQRYAALIAAVETKSMSGAAKRLGYTPSGIVRLINALETDMGFSLLTRSSSGVLPTPECDKLIPIVKELLRCEEKARQASARIRGLAEGALSVGVQANASPVWLVDLICGYRDKFPEVDLKLFERPKAELEEMLQARELDAAVMCGRPSDTQWHLLQHCEVVAWLPADCELAHNNSVFLAELAQLPVISLSSVADVLDEGLLASRGLQGQAGYDLLDASCASRFVGAGCGACLALEQAPLSAEGVAVRQLTPRRFVEYGLAVVQPHAISPAAGEFASWAVEFAAGLPPVDTSE